MGLIHNDQKTLSGYKPQKYYRTRRGLALYLKERTFSSLPDWHPTPVLLPGKSHGWRSLVGCSPWGCEESDTTEQLHFDFSLSCIGEGNGNPLQYSCLENPRDGGAWWATVYGVAQSRTRLKRLSSSSSSNIPLYIRTTSSLSVHQTLNFNITHSLIKRTRVWRNS